MNENNLSEQEKTIRDKMDTQDFDISESNFVADSDKKFDKDINKGQQTGMDIQAMENTALFVDGTFSINDLKEREYIKDVLGRALYDNRMRLNNIENELYQFTKDDSISKIIEVQFGNAIATTIQMMIQKAKTFGK